MHSTPYAGAAAQRHNCDVITAMIILEHYVSRGRHCVPEAMHLMACVALGLLLYGHIMSVVCNVCILHAEAAFAGRWRRRCCGGSLALAAAS
jgi:hypothetical protein